MSFDKSERSTIKEYASRYGVKVIIYIIKLAAVPLAYKSERSTIKEYASRYGVKVTISGRVGTLGWLTTMGTFIRFWLVGLLSWVFNRFNH